MAYLIGQCLAGSVCGFFLRCLGNYISQVKTNEVTGKALHFHIGFLLHLQPQGQSHPMFWLQMPPH